MNIETFRAYCLAKTAVTESFPFDDTTLVLKVMDKIFAITDLYDEFQIALKCDPLKAIELRETYPAVKPGYHMNKNNWNTITIDGSIPDTLLKFWIDESYLLVVSKMSKKNQALLSEMK
jgi:predicted DNA-binding protein (MmcQ/YjbR family)